MNRGLQKNCIWSSPKPQAGGNIQHVILLSFIAEVWTSARDGTRVGVSAEQLLAERGYISRHSQFDATNLYELFTQGY